jgi:hypothetical protein
MYYKDNPSSKDSKKKGPICKNVLFVFEYEGEETYFCGFKHKGEINGKA